jgi:hypothetical protein
MKPGRLISTQAEEIFYHKKNEDMSLLTLQVLCSSRLILAQRHHATAVEKDTLLLITSNRFTPLRIGAHFCREASYLAAALMPNYMDKLKKII